MPDKTVPARKLYVAVVVTFIASFALGGIVGFGLGFFTSEFGSRVLEGVSLVEEPADVNRPNTISQPHFQVEYPGNWTIDDDADYYEGATYFSIDSPGGDYAAFELYGFSTSPEEAVKEARENHQSLLRVSEQTSLDRWGHYEGVGIKLVGTYIGTPSEVHIFSYSDDERSFTVSQWIEVENKHFVTPGFDLIERSFTLKDVPPKQQDDVTAEEMIEEKAHPPIPAE